MADEFIHVIIIDRNIAWREAIASLINQQPDMEVIGSKTEMLEASQGHYQPKPDVVIIDSLPSSEAEWAIFDRLKRMFPNAR